MGAVVAMTTLVTAGVGLAGAAFGLDARGAKAPATPPASAPPSSAVTPATGPDPVPGAGAVPSPGPEAVPSAATPAAGTPAATTPPGPGHVEVLHLAAPGDSGLRDVWVYRPDGPDSSSLPVLYFLHGVPGNAADVFNAGLAKALDRDIAAGGTPMVVVSPDGNGSHHDDTEWANAADGTDQVESFVTDVVIPTVEGAHPRDEAHRAIAGFSMGGYGAANIALRNRDLFGQVAAVAGYFHIDDPARVFGRDAAVESANRPLDHIDRAVGLRILLIDGNHDTEPVVAGESRRFASALERAGITPELDIVPGGHDWQMVSSQFPTLLRFLDAGW
jgi:S-formylglutathione hydrolase FrmB